MTWFWLRLITLVCAGVNALLGILNASLGKWQMAVLVSWPVAFFCLFIALFGFDKEK